MQLKKSPRSEENGSEKSASSKTRSAEQRATAARVFDDAGSVIETHEQAGEFDVMLTYALGPSASTSIGTPSHFAAALRSWKTRTLIEEPLVSKASNRA
jgi:hypothetical protein